MTPTPSLSRRQLLVTSAVGLALALARPRGLRAAEAGTSPDDRALALQASALLTIPADATLVGRAYLEQAPDEADPDRLVDLVFPQVGSPTRAALARALFEQVRADFEQGRMVPVQGWLLARTEARLYALASL